jgi:hypothetical protein
LFDSGQDGGALLILQYFDGPKLNVAGDCHEEGYFIGKHNVTIAPKISVQ